MFLYTKSIEEIESYFLSLAFFKAHYKLGVSK